MKIAYINSYNSSTGYSNAGINTILALDRAGVDVVPMDFKLASQRVDAPARVHELARGSPDGISMIVSHTLPHLLSYKGGVKNVGYFHAETSHFKPSNWQNYLNLMDANLVCCPENRDAATKSGVTIPTHVIPIPVDPDALKGPGGGINLKIGNRYAFYTIADWSYRKNLAGLVKAYLEEFTVKDQVVLVLKSYCDGKSSVDSLNFIKGEIDHIKRQLRRSCYDNFAHIIVVTDYLNTQQILAIHNQCHVYCDLERGGAWCIPQAESCVLGKPVICNGGGGHMQYVKGYPLGYPTPYTTVPVYGMAECPFPGLYTNGEGWFEPNLEELKSLMRFIYQTRPTCEFNHKSLHWMGLEQAGHQIKGVLEKI